MLDFIDRTAPRRKPFAGIPEGAAPCLHAEMHFGRGAGRIVAGVDEAGRGPIAGAVVAAAVVLGPTIPKGLNDSKKLSAERRRDLYLAILDHCAVGIGVVDNTWIDSFDILKAAMRAMRIAIEALPSAPVHVLVDGLDVPAGISCNGSPIIKGDARSLSIAAASIVAKVTRDRAMVEACETYPGYGFSAHAGYGTAEHLAAIGRLGPCPIHRLSFKPFRKDPQADLFG